MINSLRRVPWYSSLEWLDVFNGAFSNDEEARRVAIARIALWESKSSKVPVAVICTRLIVEASLADEHRGQRGEGEIQMLYGMAIVRFVNSHVDLEQKKVYAESIAVAAKELGIPSEIVNCRHRITHGEMPSIDLLRHTAGLCFQYLELRYWKPQADIIRTRVQSMGNSKNLATGLLALLRDIEVVAMPDGLEKSLQSLAQEFVPRKITVETLVFTALSVCNLKPRDAIRTLKGLGIPEVIKKKQINFQLYGNPAFVAAISWSLSLKDIIPKCLNFVDNLLHSCPNEDVTLSFLKDLVFAAYDPEIHFGAAICVIWILARGSPNLSFRLLSHTIHCIAPLPDGPCNGLDEEAFSLWLNSLEVTSDQESHFMSKLNNKGYERRLLSWLRVFMLLPPSSCEETTTNGSSLPSVIDLILHAYCSPRLDALIAGRALHNLRDTFCRQLVYNINLVQSRALAACRESLGRIAQYSLETLITKTLPITVRETELLQQLLRLFSETSIKVAHSTSSKLLDWFLTRLPSSGPRISKKIVVERFFSDVKRNTSATRLVEDFQAILSRLRAESSSDQSTTHLPCAPQDFSEQFKSIHQQLVNSPQSASSSNVWTIPTSVVPWTDPGTLPQGSSCSITGVMPIKASATFPASEILKINQGAASTGGGSRKRRALIDSSELAAISTSQAPSLPQQAKRLKGERTQNLKMIREHRRVTPLAIRQLEIRNAEQQQQQFSDNQQQQQQQLELGYTRESLLKEWAEVENQLQAALYEDATMQS